AVFRYNVKNHKERLRLILEALFFMEIKDLKQKIKRHFTAFKPHNAYKLHKVSKHNRIKYIKKRDLKKISP
ncbi:MAG: hypothetical protein ACRCV0_06680, partial [Brevinema sp.]